MPGHYKAITIVGKPIRRETQYQPAMVQGATLAAKTCEVFATSKPQSPLHSDSSSFPVHLLHMIAPHSQNMTSTQAAALQYLTPSPGCHAGAKAMHPLAAANFRLPGPFRHR
jgi:hypothetical protein